MDMHKEGQRSFYINEALKRIAGNESLVLKLYYLNENSIKEICEITSWSEAKVKGIIAPWAKKHGKRIAGINVCPGKNIIVAWKRMNLNNGCNIQNWKLMIPDFEDSVMNEIHKKEAAKKSVWKDIRLSWVFLVLGMILGLVATNCLTTIELNYFGQHSNLVLLVIEALVVLLVISHNLTIFSVLLLSGRINRIVFKFLLDS